LLDRISFLEDVHVPNQEFSQLEQHIQQQSPLQFGAFMQGFLQEVQSRASNATHREGLSSILFEIMQEYELATHAGSMSDGQQLWIASPPHRSM
jgi:hypothetical protein